jgi:GDP-4-dehydro-6-deoxy-D-mannose reductase
MPVWLVTGASGFLGRHLLSLLKRSDLPALDIVTIGRRCPSGHPAEQFIAADLTCSRSIRSALASIQPDVVFHLAGRTPPAPAEELYQANSVATALLLDALRLQGSPVRVVMAGSAAELGPVPEADLPVGEDYRCRPVGEYGLSKWLATTAGLAARPPLEVIIARVFNPIGPGTPGNQSLGRFAAELARPEVDALTVGSLDPGRDFVDVRDVARALVALARRGRESTVYHVGTGESHRVGDGLDHLLRLCARPIAVFQDPKLASDPGPPDSRAAIGRIVEHTGWRPEISWEQSLNDLWDEALGSLGCH